MNFRNSLTRRLLFIARFVISCLATHSVIASSIAKDARNVSSQTITNALAASLAINESYLLKSGSIDLQTSSWLAASPTVQVAYLKGVKEADTDEMELSVNLAIKSKHQRDIDNKLATVDIEIRQQQIDLQKLYLSGLIREAVWSYKLAKTQHSNLLEKKQILETLKVNSQELMVAGEASDFGLLIIKKEINTTQIDLITIDAEVEFWMEQFKFITGFSDVPEDIAENIFDISFINVDEHPNIKQTVSLWEQSSLLLRASSSDAAPWNLSLAARTTETLGIEEELLGVSFEVPLSFIRSDSQRITNEWGQRKNQFDKDYRSLRLKLNAQIKKLERKRQVLISKNELLGDSVEINQRIMKQIDLFKRKNEISQEIILRKVIDAIQTRSDYAVNQILLQQNNALIRQSVGIPL